MPNELAKKIRKVIPKPLFIIFTVIAITGLGIAAIVSSKIYKTRQEIFGGIFCIELVAICIALILYYSVYTNTEHSNETSRARERGSLTPLPPAYFSYSQVGQEGALLPPPAYFSYSQVGQEGALLPPPPPAYSRDLPVRHSVVTNLDTFSYHRPPCNNFFNHKTYEEPPSYSLCSSYDSRIDSHDSNTLPIRNHEVHCG